MVRSNLLSYRPWNGSGEPDASLRAAFQKVKAEFNEHLDAINENTNELQANYEYARQLDEKMQKLNERFEEIRLLLHGLVKKYLKEEHLPPVPVKEQLSLCQFLPRVAKEASLSPYEQRVFLALFTAPVPVTYNELAQKLDMSEYLVGNYITNLMEKGIPVVKSYRNNAVFLDIDKEFREEHAKNGRTGPVKRAREQRAVHDAQVN